ncbi:MAG: hypothetical protein EXR61_04660 [Chloroflexi bacterium]|nr:hypothetical protein [Chloroflexota bacterium]
MRSNNGEAATPPVRTPITLTRRRLLRLGGLTAAGLGLAACAPVAQAPASASAPAAPAATTRPSPSAKPVRTLKVGHLTRQLGNLVPQYDDVGPMNGVKFDVSFFPDGRALLQALSTGDILLAAPTKVQLIQAMALGVDLVMVCGYAGGYITYLQGTTAAVQPGDWSSVKAAAATRKAAGKPFRIGVPTGSLQHISLLQQLRAAGIDGDKDLEVVNVPFAEAANALDAGQLDMAAALALFGAQAIVQNKARLFLHAKATPLGFFDVGFVTTRKLVKERPDEMQDIVAAHYQAMKNIADDPTRGLAREVKYSELPEAVVKKSYEFLTFDHRVDLNAIRGTERVMRDLGLHKDDLQAKIADYVDLSFLAKASGRSLADVGTW